MALKRAGQAVESLERRWVFNNTYFPIAGGPLQQNWEGNLLTANDNWSAVPSIEGFRGDNVVAAPGAIPDTVLAGDDPGVIDVNVDQTSPGSFTTGGVSEFNLASPIGTSGNISVGFQGSGTADAPYLKFYVNSTGVANVRITYDLIDLDNGTTTLAQPVALQYRIGNSGNFINVPDGFVANAASPLASTAGLVTSKSVVLPAGAGNQANLQIRLITTDGDGTDQYIGVDNISIGNDNVVNSGTFTIAPTSRTVLENVGTTLFDVVRTGGTSGAVTVPYTIVTGTGNATAGSDFVEVLSGVVSFADGSTTASTQISATILNDAVFESTETFQIILGTPSAGSLGADSTATVTITDDDTPGTFSFTETTATITEGGSRAFTITRTNGAAGAVDVTYSIGGTAQSGSDFTALTGTVSFANGELSKTITISTIDDAIAEQTETVILTLLTASNSGAIGSPAVATLSIQDNDSAIPTGLILNEISINVPSTNTPYQFFELRGTPGATLAGVYIMLVDGDAASAGAASAGVLRRVIDLTGATIGANGLLLVHSPLGHAAENPTTGVRNDSANFEATDTFFGFETDSVTFLLTFVDTAGGTLVPSVGTDFDTVGTGTGGIGTLNALPTGITVLDSVGFVDGSTNDLSYSAARLKMPNSTNSATDAPDAAGRLDSNIAPNELSAWYFGNIVNDGLTTSASKLFTSTASQLSANFPPGAKLTPGGFLPSLRTAVLNYAGTTQTVTVTFNEDVTASVAGTDFELTNLTAAQSVALTLVGTATTNAAGQTVATFSFSGTGGLKDFVLVDGNYQITAKAGQVEDAFGANPIASSAAFFFLNADLNQNRNVNFGDLLTLAQNYGLSSGATFAQGDVNYDGNVNFGDLLALAQRYGGTLAAPQAALLAQDTATTAKKRTSFGATVIA